ncbi:hypothetical protein [Achromobacter aloeverae]
MAQMKQYKLVVFLNAQEGREGALSDWLAHTHIPDVLKIPGFSGAQRFQPTLEQRAGARPQWKFLIIYDIETDDLQAMLDELKRREGTPMMVGTDAIAGGFVNCFEPVGDVVTHGR